MIVQNLTKATAEMVQILANVPFGAEISYAELHRVSGFTRARLDSARRIAIRDYGAVFHAVRTFGLVRLNIDEAPKVGQYQRAKNGRGSRRSIKAMENMIRETNDPEILDATRAEIGHARLMTAMGSDFGFNKHRKQVVIAEKARADRRLRG